MTDIPGLPADLGRARIKTVLRVTDKTLLARGDYDGHPAVIKVLRTTEEPWHAALAHESSVYEAFRASPPPVRVPALIHTDHRRVLVLEHIPGPGSQERYPTQPLPGTVLTRVLEAVAAFQAWNPHPGVLSPIFDYAERIDRYETKGFFDKRGRLRCGDCSITPDWWTRFSMAIHWPATSC